MKGFPNQVADFTKLSRGLAAMRDLIVAGVNPRDDGVFGEELVRRGVLSTGHTPEPIEQYLTKQLRKKPDRQSFRTSARGLRELYRLLGLIREPHDTVELTELGEQAADFDATTSENTRIEFWRRVVRDFSHQSVHVTASHPYQVLLHLVGKRPGITRAKCALALEARDDSPEELARIVELSDLDEDDIRKTIGVSKSNWDNAKKVLPRFAEQLGDVFKVGQTYTLAASPGHAIHGGAPAPGAASTRPRNSRHVSPETIGMAGIGDRKESYSLAAKDSASEILSLQARADRLRRHNLIVRRLAVRLNASGFDLYEDPFDLLALAPSAAFLIEVKTLDGSPEDERTRVREALAQLLYYDAFLTSPIADDTDLHRIACFETEPTHDHKRWLNSLRIGVLWEDGDSLRGDDFAVSVLGEYIGDLR